MELDRVALVGVAHEAHELPDFDADAEPVEHFAGERLFIGLAFFDAAAWKFPEAGQDGGRAALRDQVAPAILDHGGDHSDGRGLHAKWWAQSARAGQRNWLGQFSSGVDAEQL